MRNSIEKDQAMSMYGSARRTLYLVLGVSLLSSLACDRNTDKTGGQGPEVLEEPAAVGTPAAIEPAKASSKRRATDVHAHLSPLSYPVAAEFMKQVGLERVVNMSGGHGEEYLARHLELADAHGARFALFLNMDWEGIDEPWFGERRAEDLARAVAMGVTGLKISKGLGLGVRTADGKLLAVDDPRLDPIWEKAGELGVVVAIHTSDPKAFFEPPGPQNERHAELSHAPSWSFYGDEFPSRKELLDARDRMIARHPGTTFMLLHFANNPEDVDYVDTLLETHPNLIVDVAARIGEIGRHDPDKVRRIFIKHQDRILFATDIMLTILPQQGQLAYSLTLGSIGDPPPTLESIKPFYDLHWRYFESDEDAIDHPVPIQGPWQVHPLNLPGEVLEKLYYKNSEAIIFAPWLGRRAAQGVIQRAAQMVSD